MPENFEQEHFDVLDEASEIFVARSKVRGQMWLETPIARELAMISEKRERAGQALVRGLDDPDFMKEFRDSLLDLINMAAFAIKKADRGIRA